MLNNFNDKGRMAFSMVADVRRSEVRDEYIFYLNKYPSDKRNLYVTISATTVAGLKDAKIVAQIMASSIGINIIAFY